MAYEEYRNEKGQLHRIDGPAIIDGVEQIWGFNGRTHRIDGPAYIYGEYEEWYINNKQIMEPKDYIHDEIKDYIYET